MTIANTVTPAADSFEIEFDLSAFAKLDGLADAVNSQPDGRQPGEWFLTWCSARDGIRARTYSVMTHYRELHAWVPRVRPQEEIESHISSIFFGMASAIECVAFGLNALGFRMDPKAFADITDAKALQRVSPRILGGSKPLPGITKYFPRVQNHWFSNQSLVDEIAEHHNVSKHRSALFYGGRMRNDPPLALCEALGIAQSDLHGLVQLMPMAEVLLSPNPKAPLSERLADPNGGRGGGTLEALVERFRILIAGIGEAALGDYSWNSPSLALAPRREAPRSA